MPNRLKLISSNGFTVIELLIVFGVIGILAVVMLAVINPAEQIRRSRDTERLSQAKQLIDAYTRYYAPRAEYPWNTVYGTPAALATTNPDFRDGRNSKPLLDSGEIKKSFVSQEVFTELYLTEDVSDRVSVCFEPESKNARSGSIGDLLTIGAQPPTGTEGVCSSEYVADGRLETCYICATN